MSIQTNCETCVCVCVYLVNPSLWGVKKIIIINVYTRTVIPVFFLVCVCVCVGRRGVCQNIPAECVTNSRIPAFQLNKGGWGKGRKNIREFWESITLMQSRFQPLVCVCVCVCAGCLKWISICATPQTRDQFAVLL